MADILQLDEQALAVVVRGLVSLAIAGALGALLAFRPRRRGTPRRQTEVIHAQVILALVGALVMIVVGESLARAFGIVGVAGLVRYRARISNPKDAGVLLCTLSIGLLIGAELYVLAAGATALFLFALWVLESREPVVFRRFRLRVKTDDPGASKATIVETLQTHSAEQILRSLTPSELVFDVLVPSEEAFDRLAAALRDAPVHVKSAKWERKQRRRRMT